MIVWDECGKESVEGCEKKAAQDEDEGTRGSNDKRRKSHAFTVRVPNRHTRFGVSTFCYLHPILWRITMCSLWFFWFFFWIGIFSREWKEVGWGKIEKSEKMARQSGLQKWPKDETQGGNGWPEMAGKVCVCVSFFLRDVLSNQSCDSKTTNKFKRGRRGRTI